MWPLADAKNTTAEAARTDLTEGIDTDLDYSVPDEIFPFWVFWGLIA